MSSILKTFTWHFFLTLASAIWAASRHGHLVVHTECYYVFWLHLWSESACEQIKCTEISEKHTHTLFPHLHWRCKASWNLSYTLNTINTLPSPWIPWYQNRCSLGLVHSLRRDGNLWQFRLPAPKLVSFCGILLLYLFVQIRNQDALDKS